MAPSRRKGASKAAAAATAAACQQWKVGDLVLAKVKGFPAWPATVSEPEKWGYSKDWKKVLVYFFGTQQIAFCNPADVEAFTEEKKQTLLTKRHGKGSDFVRAVHEIIDSYEKLKKEEKDIKAQCSNEVTLTTVTECIESFADSGLNDESPALKVEPDLTKANGSEPSNDALHVNNSIPEDPFVVKEAPLLPNTYSRKKLSGLQAQQILIQKRAPSARRSRTSSRPESNRFQNFTLSSDILDRSAGSIRTKRMRRSPPDVSEVHDTDSPALVSNKENGSGVVTVDSDTHSLNDGSTVDSVECCEGDVELSQRLDFLVKKKRKPSRKRVCNGDPKVSNRVNGDDGMETEVHNCAEVSLNDIGKLNGHYSGEAGDEHLPLVKRARVRMSNTSTKVEVKSSEVSSSCAERSPTSVNYEVDVSVNENPAVVNVHVDDSLPLNRSPSNKPLLLWEAKKQQNVSSVDVEAALPPSKRLHRALEAMSANVAEHGQTSSEAPFATKMSNGYVSSPSNTTKIESEVHKIDGFSTNVAEECTSRLSPTSNPPILEETARLLVDMSGCNELIEGDNSSMQEASEYVSVDAVTAAISVDAHVEEIVVLAQSPKPLSPQMDNQQANLECNQSLLELKVPSIDSETENLKFRNSCKEENLSEFTKMSLEHVSRSAGIAAMSPQNDASLNLHDVNSNYETTKLSTPPAENNQEMSDILKETKPDENKQDIDMSEVVKEMKPTVKDTNVTPPIQEEVSRTAVQSIHLYNSSSLSDDTLSHHKDVPGTRSSSSPTDGLDSKCASPPNTSTDNSNLLENSVCCSPDARLQHEKPKHASGNSSTKGEINAALASFEANLGTLKRTKESIARATRIAIDCAKFGVAPKVMETIALHLETEFSLHKRIDLFFLVDSITQCSRGLKGDVGGIYPSLIQAKLPRLLSAAAPPGSSALENRRQCLKVLRLWQERRLLPESVIRRHIRELDSLSTSSSSGVFTSRRQSRTERAFDDPLREMEGMVDEYGSNSSFQLPGFCMPPMVKDGDDEDEGSDSDGGNFESVTPEHNNNNSSENPEERGWACTPAPATEKRSHILEDVDGELEMEDVAPSCDEPRVITSTADIAAAAAVAVNSLETSSHQHFPPPFAPPLPKDVPPSSPPPLPTSPPPPHPPPPPPPLPSQLPDSTTKSLYNIKDDTFQYHAPPHESRDPQCSISSNSMHVIGSHQPIRPVNSVQQVDGSNMHHKAFHLPPPHPAPSNQFSYVQVDSSRRDIPPQSYPPQFHYVPNTDSGNYYNGHDRMNLAPHEEKWRFPAPVSGTCYPESSGLPYGHGAYGGPPCEPAPVIPSHSWPPPPINHREPIPHRPTPDGPIPAAVRAPNYWRPR